MVKPVSAMGTTVSAEDAAASTAHSEFAAAVGAVVDRSVAPTIVARGGAVRVVGASEGAVTLEASGSPGAMLPVIGRIEALLRAAVPELSDVRVVWPESERAVGTEPDGRVDRVRRVLDDKVNPAIAAHRGRVVLVDLTDGRASIRLEGGCQGCSLAEVTVRQGIERLVRAHCPEVIAVIDVTDHSAGLEPFYTPDKR